MLKPTDNKPQETRFLATFDPDALEAAKAACERHAQQRTDIP